MNKQQLLDQIKADIITSNVCPDLAKQATQLVFGEGNSEADIILIGEAPGRKEDEQGLPFIGASGKFLQEMLASIHLKREQVYITSIVKYRPPNNRDPSTEEKAAFFPYLQRQLEVIKPLLVVTLGRHSMDSLAPGQKISDAHGQPKKVHLKMLGGEGNLTLVILPLYHPAAALYNGRLRQTLKDDFAQIPKILETLRKEN